MIGHAILFFVAGFAQFNFALNKGPGSSLLYLLVAAAGIYLLGWWALLTFIIGGIGGGRLAVMQRHRDHAIDRVSDIDLQ